MAYYTRKPELVEAIQWTGNNLQEIVDFVGKDSIIRIAFRNPKANYQICYMDLEGYDGPEENIVTLDIGVSNSRQLWPSDYLIKHDYSEYPNLCPFESMQETKFKFLYQPDSCDLDGSGCE